MASPLLNEGAISFDWGDELLAKTVWPERAEAAPAEAPAATPAAG